MAPEGLALAAAFCFALSSLILGALKGRVPLMQLARWQQVAAFGFTALVGLLVGGWQGIEPWQYGLLAASGFVGITIASTTYFGALYTIGPRLTALLFSLTSPFSLGLGFVFLGETVSAGQGAGVALVVGGIGLAIALRAARDGANVVVAAKTAEPHKKLPGTIYSAAEEVEKAGGQALPIVVDVREPESVNAAVEAAVARFGGIDICVNNASAIQLTGTLQTDIRRYDLMNQVNARGTFIVSRACIPHLKQASNPHVLMLSPPLDMSPHWFQNHVAYTMAKFGMSMCVLGWAGELRGAGIAANALWPRTTIATAAIQNLLGGDMMMKRSRWPSIMGDAGHWIFTQPSRECTGNFFLDEDIVRDKMGKKDLSEYSVDPSQELQVDFFV